MTLKELIKKYFCLHDWVWSTELFISGDVVVTKTCKKCGKKQFAEELRRN